MVAIEYTVAFFISILKKKTKTATFIGPPPIPRKLEINPREKPIIKMTKRFLTSRFL